MTHPLWVAPFPRFGPWIILSVERRLSVSKYTCINSLYSRLWMRYNQLFEGPDLTPLLWCDCNYERKLNFKGENHKKIFDTYTSRQKLFCSAKLRQLKTIFGYLCKQVTKEKKKQLVIYVSRRQLRLYVFPWVSLRVTGDLSFKDSSQRQASGGYEHGCLT